MRRGRVVWRPTCRTRPLDPPKASAPGAGPDLRTARRSARMPAPTQGPSAGLGSFAGTFQEKKVQSRQRSMTGSWGKEVERMWKCDSTGRCATSCNLTLTGFLYLLAAPAWSMYIYWTSCVHTGALPYLKSTRPIINVLSYTWVFPTMKTAHKQHGVIVCCVAYSLYSHRKQLTLTLLILQCLFTKKPFTSLVLHEPNTIINPTWGKGTVDHVHLHIHLQVPPPHSSKLTVCGAVHPPVRLALTGRAGLPVALVRLEQHSRERGGEALPAVRVQTAVPLHQPAHEEHRGGDFLLHGLTLTPRYTDTHKPKTLRA